MTWSIFRVLLVMALVARTVEAEDAEQLYNQGQTAFDAHRFAEAAAVWERSYALSAEPALLFNIGQAYRQNAQPGDCTRASNAYVKFLALDPTSEQRPVAEGFIRSLQECVAREATPPPNPKPSEPAPIVAPPREGTNDPGRTKRIAGLVVGGSGLALVAAGVYFGFQVRSIANEVTAACATTCDWATLRSRDASGKTAERTQWLSYGVGGAALAAGAVLYWLGTRTESTATIGISPGSRGAALTWSGAW